MSKKPGLRLRTRIALTFLALFFAWSGILLVALRSLLLWRFNQVYRDRGADVAHALLAECVPLVTNEDAVGLGEVPARTMKANLDVRYLAVEDDAGNILASTFPGRGLPRDLRNLSHHALPRDDISVRLVSYRHELIYDYVARRGPATVRVGFSLASANDFVSLITFYLLWLGAVGVVAVFVAAYRISRPIEDLVIALAKEDPGDSRGPKVPATADTRETRSIMNRFAELTGALQERNDQLETARKFAYLGELSAGLAHEVNNPLGVVVLNSGLLSRRCDSGEIVDEAAKEVAMLKLAAGRATLAVQGVLQFARYSIRGAEPLGQPLRVEPMIRETLELLAGHFRTRECRPIFEIAPGLPTITCDASGIQQVLFNLLLNALDACAVGGNIVVRASLDGETLVLEVVDDGEGMTEEVLRRAKEPFFTTKTEERGLGLGLAVSQSIVAAHGGRLEFRSRPGCGTEASIRIPVRRKS